MPTRNSLTVQALPQLAHVTMTRLAVGLPIAQLQRVAQVMGDEQAPHFTPDQEPNRDGAIFSSVGGQTLYRPQLRVAGRTTAPLGPEVRFLKDPAGTVRLMFELEEAPPPDLPAGAEPLALKVGAVTLTWQEGGQARQRAFDPPTLVGTDDPQNVTAPNFALRFAAELRPEEVDPLYRATSTAGAGATLEVTLSWGYWVDQVVVVNPPPPPRRTWNEPETTEPPAELQPPERPRRVPPPRRTLPVTLTQFGMVASPIRPLAATLRAAPLAERAVADVSLTRLGGLRDSVLLRPDLLDLVRDQARQRETRHDFRSVDVVRAVPFFFDPALEHNRPIYSAVVGDPALGETWENIGFGLVRAAGFPNTVYRLPDEIRLAYNPDLAAPHVIPTLYRGEDDEVRVRVLLRAAPWYNPDALVKLRDVLRRTSAGALSAANVVMGGYDKAVLRLGGAFPEQIRALGGAGETEIGLEGSFELVLDLSLEFYQLLTELLVGPVGLTGEVNVTLRTGTGADGQPQTQVFHVPLRLHLGRVSALPAEVRVPGDAVSPGQVQVLNTAGAETRLGGCAVRLLQYDANSAAPLEVFEATVQAPAFPVTLAPGAGLTLEVRPRDEAPAELWNAVQVELTGYELTAPTRQVLDHIHEVAPSGTLRWTLAVECPLLTRSPLPPGHADLYRVEVKIVGEGLAPQQVVLSLDKPRGQVTMQRTLRDILGDAGADFAHFHYQVRNIYLDHPGEWSESKDGEGSNLFVFPNPAENGG